MAFEDDDRDRRDEGDAALSVSRRAFLKTVSASSLAAGVLSPAESDAQAVPAPVGPGDVPIKLTIDGKTHALSVEPRVTLLDAMRDRLDITGLKRVCDRGTCGACTVIIEGRTHYSCTLLAIDMQGVPIRTVEGLTKGTVLHPVQEAFCKHDGLMCGFCTPGFVVSAVALLEKTPSPTADQAKAALAGNICRCGTYTRVLEAVLDTKGVARG
jgi:aerobic-type carbon monoxide dehydrogenase small subunit (CoxS/CutS family)